MPPLGLRYLRRLFQASLAAIPEGRGVHVLGCLRALLLGLPWRKILGPSALPRHQGWDSIIITEVDNIRCSNSDIEHLPSDRFLSQQSAPCSEFISNEQDHVNLLKNFRAASTKDESLQGVGYSSRPAHDGNLPAQLFAQVDYPRWREPFP